MATFSYPAMTTTGAVTSVQIPVPVTTSNEFRASLGLAARASKPKHPMDDLVGAVLELRGAFLDYYRASR